MPLRMKEVHIVRQPFLFNMVWPMFRQFVGDKLKKRVSTHCICNTYYIVILLFLRYCCYNITVVYLPRVYIAIPLITSYYYYHHRRHHHYHYNIFRETTDDAFSVSMSHSMLRKRFRNPIIVFQLYFHGNKMSSLHKHLDINTLPEDYGGKKPKLNYSSADWYPVMSDLQNYIAGK